MKNEKLIGVFNEIALFERAVQIMKDSDIEIEELFMPVPVHQAVRNVTGRSRLPILAYFLGLGSIISVMSFLYYTSVISWPLNIGGKPSNAFPSFIIVTLVLTILTVTILSLLAFSISSELYPGKKADIMDLRALDDKFLIIINSDKVPGAENILRQNGANEIIQKPG